IAPVEDFYFDGKPCPNLIMEGLPYREEKISVGTRTVHWSAPDWHSTLIPLAHQLKDEYALTLLNYHQTEPAFVKVKAPELKGLYLVNPAEQVYQVVNEEGEALLQVGSESASIWIATRHRERIAGCTLQRDEAGQYQAARERFLSQQHSGE